MQFRSFYQKVACNSVVLTKDCNKSETFSYYLVELNNLLNKMTLSKTMLLLPIIFFTATPVRAENQIQNRIEQRQEIRQENQEDRQEMLQENRENRRELRTTIVQDRLELRRQNALKIGNNIVIKLENRFNHLEKIKARLQSKITALKTTRDMTEAQTKLDAYDTSKYAADLAALKAKVATITTTDKPKTLAPALKDITNLVQKDLKNLHQYLVDVLKLIIKAPKLN
jgi:DNA repair exonuclease SbcCD ATPase subunit